jgi:hypothetical protein
LGGLAGGDDVDGGGCAKTDREARIGERVADERAGVGRAQRGPDDGEQMVSGVGDGGQLT